MKKSYHKLIAAVSLALATTAQAASFSITSGTNSTARTLATGESGAVSSGATLTLAGSNVPITVTGSASITNAGTISQTGTGRTIDANTAGLTLTLINSGTISAVGSNETIRMAQTATLNLTNQAGAFITSQAADAVRPGNNSTITNYGTISANPPNVASPAGSDGIDLRTERTGIMINNYATISGRHGIATDGANVGPSSVTVNNYNGGTISALNGSGVNVDGVSATATANVTNAFGGTIKGGVFSNATSGDGDGIDIDGVLTLNNSGDVLGLGAKGNNNPEAIAAGGGSITNNATGRIIGSSLSADAPNGDTSKLGSGILIDDSNGGNAIAVTTVINSGTIQGKTGFGIKIIGTFGDTITNNVGGGIFGANNAQAVIQTGGGNDIVNNAGVIGHSGGVSQVAISTEDGDDTVNISGNANLNEVAIAGGMDGGTGFDTLNFTMHPNTNNPASAFGYNGAITNFESVKVLAGTVILSSFNSTYAGSTQVGDGTTAATLSQAGSHTGGSAITVKNNAKLSGYGTETLATDTSLLTIEAGGTLAAGNYPLNTFGTGRFTLGKGSALINGTLAFKLNGNFYGSDYDQFRLGFFGVPNTGTFTLGLTSSLSLDVNFTPTVGNQFTLVEIADDNTLISGTFAGLDEGAIFSQDGQSFSISYVGGSGNDIVVTAVTAVPEASTYAFYLLGTGSLLIVLRRRKTA